MKSINVGGTIIDLNIPKVMGIINATPDSFYSGSRINEIDAMLTKAERMINEGATFIDIGGYSTRPGGDNISEEEEVRRIKEPIRELTNSFPGMVFSIDTFRSGVAAAAVAAGAQIVNDVSGGHLDPQMYSMVGELQVPYVGMHMRGTPQTMQSQTDYDDLTGDIYRYFGRMLDQLADLGVIDVLLDPGFGFAKTVDQNYDLLSSLGTFLHLQRPLVVGISRKSMIYRRLDTSPQEALNGSTVLNTVALLKGASILRVHDVKEAVEAVKLVGFLKN